MQTQKQAGHFRSDIEGLRAVAALSILLFHIDPDWPTGGFVGVDLFFVISGYLITSSICRDVAEGGFSLAAFYARRIRRLYPALLVTIAATMIGAFFFLFPRELLATAKGAIATVFYVSNFYFAAQVDYFSEDKVRPLLHTWSLAVEEQFYLVYPLFLLALLRRGRPIGRFGLIGPLLGLTAASLALAEYMMRTEPSWAFYISPTRFWELAIGGLTAALPPLAWSRGMREAASLAGSAAIAGALLFFTDATPVPGLPTLLPVLGMAVLIKTGEAPTMATRLLSIGPARFVGRISYALYLVHWPLIVLLKANDLDVPSREMKVVAFGGSILLAWLLNVLVEQPTRRIPIRGNLHRIFALGGGGTAALTAMAAVVLFAGGFRDRVNARSREMIAYLDYDAGREFRSGRCLMNAKTEREGAQFDSVACVDSISRGSPRILLLGDSHAAQYYEALRTSFPGIHLAQVTATGCRPLLHPTGSDRCVLLMQQTFRHLIGNGFFDTIILAGRWHAQDLADLRQTAAFLGSHASQVYVLGPIIEYRMPLPRLLAFSYLDNKLDEPDGDKNIDEERLWARTREIDERMARLLQPLPRHVRYLSVLDAMCRDRNDCETLTRSGQPTQFDYGHLTFDGALEVIHKLKSEGLMSGLMLDRVPSPKRGYGASHQAAL